MVSTKLNSKEEYVLVGKIVKRAVDIIGNGNQIDPLTANMDICAVIAQGTPLKLQEWLDADDFNFAHDFFGIARHINRQTGKLEDCFLPRFAA